MCRRDVASGVDSTAFLLAAQLCAQALREAIWKPREGEIFNLGRAALPRRLGWPNRGNVPQPRVGGPSRTGEEHLPWVTIQQILLSPERVEPCCLRVGEQTI